MTRPEPDTLTTSSKSRKTVPLNEGLERRVLAYALAAGAAGVGALALAPVAKGNTIETTSFNQTITGVFNPINPDLHTFPLLGGVEFRTDFFFTYTSHGFANNSARISVLQYGAKNGKAAFSGATHSGRDAAQYLGAGKVVGNNLAFTGATAVLATGFQSASDLRNNRAGGAFAGKNGFLGVAFDLGNPQPNYGWVEVNVSGGVVPNATIECVAYESSPGVAIVTPEGPFTCGAPAPTPTPEPSLPMLGLLALGSAGLALWRKKREKSEVRN